MEGVEAARIVEHLSSLGINSAASLGWYGLLDFGARGVSSAVRLSPHYFNTIDEVDRTVESLHTIPA
jgi:selenocysteine lyase/cysteine desulfurase